MRNLAAATLLSASVFLLAQACGSDDGKKKAQGPKYQSGGESNAAGGSGGRAGESNGTAQGGEATGGAGESGSSSVIGGAPVGTAGEGTGAGGVPGAGGESPIDCPQGFAECDGNLGDLCEQDISLVTSCGDCDTTCDSTNASALCVNQLCELTCLDGFADCDGVPENGCEVELDSDAENCGACGRDCAALGATCMGTACSVVPMQQAVPLNTANDGALTWAFDPTYGIFHLGYNSYELRRLPIDGNGVLTVWAPTSKTGGRGSLLAIGDEVYWAERGTGGTTFTSALYKKKANAAAATQPTLVTTPEYQVSHLRRSGNALYWFSGDYQAGDPAAYVYTRAIAAPEDDAGTRIVNVNQGAHNGITGFQVTSNALYWTTTVAGTGTAYELRTAPLSGAPISVVPAVAANVSVAVSGYYGVPSFQVQGEYLYFNRDVDDAQDGVYRYKTGDAKPTRLVLASNVNSVAVDDLYVYYLQQNQAGVWRAPINDGAGGAGEQISAVSVSRLFGVDDSFVYAASWSGANFYKIIK